MPETRNSTTTEGLGALNNKVTELGNTVAEMGHQTQKIEDVTQKQATKIDQLSQTQDTKFDLMMKMMERMNNSIMELRQDPNGRTEQQSLLPNPPPQPTSRQSPILPNPPLPFHLPPNPALTITPQPSPSLLPNPNQAFPVMSTHLQYTTPYSQQPSALPSLTTSTTLKPYQINNPYVEPEASNHTHTSHPQNNNPNTTKIPRLEVPQFDGKGVEGWLFQIERYFELHSTPREQKLVLATFHLTGEALDWYQWMYKTGQVSTWETLARDIKYHFGPSEFWNAEVALNKLQQTTTVNNYITQFVQLSMRTPGLTATNLLNRFLAGLREDVHRELVLLHPDSLQSAMGLARMAEEKLNAYKSWSTRANQPRPNPPHTNTIPTPTNRPTWPRPTANLPVRKLTAAEIAARREKGLCYNCDERFVPGHKCVTSARFQCMLMEEEDEPDETVLLDRTITPEVPIQEPMIETTFTADQTLSPPAISFHALQGIFVPTTLRFHGKINNRTVLVLVDSGSTHNFVQTKVANQLALSTTITKQLRVGVGNGEELHCEGLCLQTPLSIQGTTFHTDLFVLPMYGADVVLGARWLADIGETTFHYGDLWMRFQHNGETVTLHGLQGPAQFSRLTLAQLQKTTESGAAATFLHLNVKYHSNQETSNTTVEELPSVQNPTSCPARAAQLDKLLKDFSSVFDKPMGLPPVRGTEHHIPLLPGTAPINVRPYRYPHFQKSEIERLIQEMLTQGVIRPSSSPFSSPVLLVKKKDGTWRFCIDYRAVNAVTVRDRFPIPTVDELLDELHGACIFSKLDLRSGYHQLRMYPDDIYKTAFRTHDGHYEFTVMPFGLTNAPSTFQAAMNELFRPVLRKFVLVFFDDILVYSTSWETHVAHLREVLLILQSNFFYAKLSKCEFARDTIVYLGHVVSSLGVGVDQAKIAAVVRWPLPSTIKELRGFLGLTGYYRKFVASYAQLAAPLTNLLRKESFTWTPDATKAFQALQKALTTTPTLTLPNFSKIFTIQTDASGTGIGAVLTQEGQPIAYFSKQLSPTMQAMSTYNRELCAVVSAVHKWRQYLLGSKFVIQTDHQPLRNLLTQTIHTPEQQKWIVKLLGFDFEVQYKPGKDNGPADALSRQKDATFMQLQGTSRPVFGVLRALRQFFAQNSVAKSLMEAVSNNPSKHPNFKVHDGLLLKGQRLYVPEDSCLQDLIIHEYHDTVVGGHNGIKRTLARVAANFEWEGMANDVKGYVSRCQICQEVKPLNTASQGQLQPLPIPTEIWSDIAMDFITHLPQSAGKTVIMVVVDRLSKYSHFTALAKGFTAEKVAKAFSKTVVKLHGMPTSIISDRDPVFMNKFWGDLFRLQGTQLATSSAYHPQTDGQTEVVNRCLEDYLRCFVSDNHANWVELLHWAEYSYNTAWHSSIGMTPFQAVYGRAPPTIKDYTPGTSNVASLDDMLSARTLLLTTLKDNIAKAQSRMKKAADAHRREKSFEPGAWVYVKLRPYRQTSVRSQHSSKLSKRYYGPFRIIKRIGVVAYKLDLPSKARIHNVFHVSMLKEHKGTPPQDTPNWPAEFNRDSDDLQPKHILGFRTITRKRCKLPQLLVQWKDQLAEEATWENQAEFCTTFPDFNLEDEVIFDEGGNVTELRKKQNERKRIKSNRYPSDEYVT